MKKIMAFLLSCALLLSMAACGQDNIVEPTPEPDMPAVEDDGVAVEKPTVADPAETYTVEEISSEELYDKTGVYFFAPENLKGVSYRIIGDGELTATVTAVQEDGNRVVEFHYEGIFLEVLERLGKMPLPPYIKAELQDQERYQTVYSRAVGSAAAPTAGLHFTNELLDKIREKGITTAFVTLHVGLGTFRPVKAEEITEHHMHSELCMIYQETAAILNETRRNGGRIICVGTTSCRTLESLVKEDGSFEAKSKWTEIFIYPGYTFKAMQGLITNFHLPESTLVMLVSAFAGRDNVLNAYNEAVKERYRFFSFGDAMFIG